MPKHFLFALVVVMLGLVAGACAPAATPVPATTAPTRVSQATSAPTSAPTRAAMTAPTTAPTAAATSAVTSAPLVTRPAPACVKLPTATTVAAGQLGSSEKPIVIAFEPYIDVSRTAVAGRALADCLTKMTGLFYQIEVGANAAATIEAMGTGKAQVGFLDTTSIVQGRAKYGFDTGLIVLRTYKDKLEPFYQRQFIASKASGVKTIADLKGKTFCFGEPDSSFGAIVPRIVLAANGINPDKDLSPRFAGYADQVAIAVYKGECDAGGTFVDALTDPAPALSKTFPDILERVKVFYVTDNIPNDGVQYIKGLDPKIKQATTDALLAMANPPGKREPLVNLYKIEGFIKADNHFYKDFENMMKKAGVDPATLVR